MQSLQCVLGVLCWHLLRAASVALKRAVYVWHICALLKFLLPLLACSALPAAGAGEGDIDAARAQVQRGL